MTLKESVRAFYFWQLQNGKATGTCRAYRDTLETLPDQDKEIKEVKPGDLQAFLSSCQGSPSSLNLKKAAIRSFFHWALENDYIGKDPSRLIRMEKIPAKEAHYLSLKEVQKFRQAIQGTGRDELLFSLYLMTGCRLSEIQSLNIGDVRGKKTIQVLGKGRKSRQVFLPEYLTRMVKNSVNGNPPDSPLFMSCRGQRLTRGAIQTLFRKYADRAGIKGVSVHSLRHTFATTVYSKTKDLRLTQELLGHSSPAMTARYAHVAETEKRKAVQRLYSGN